MSVSLDELYEELEYYQDIEISMSGKPLDALEYVRRRITIVQQEIKELESLGSRWG